MQEKHKQQPSGIELWIQRLVTLKETFVKNDAQALIFLSFALLCIGNINWFTSQYASQLAADAGVFRNFLAKQGAFFVIACVVAFVFYRIDYRNWKKSNWYSAYIVLIVLMSLVTILFSEPVNGARRWIQIGGGATIQPSEFAKLFGVVWAAAAIDSQVKKQGAMYYLEHFPWQQQSGLNVLGKFGNQLGRWIGMIPKRNRQPHFLAKFLWIPLLFSLLTILQPDMGTAMMILGFPMLMALMAGFAKKEYKYTFIVGILGGVLVSLLAWLSEYRRKRLLAYWDPWSDTTGSGFQMTQSILSISSGHLWGEGLGKGVSKFSYLPEAHTDFAFAIWSQETGFIGVLAVLILFVLFTWTGFSIAKHSKDYLGKILATGLTIFLVLQSLFNIAMVVGLTPITGVPLPFISYGGSSLVCNAIAIGILLNIARRNIQTDKVMRKSPKLSSMVEGVEQRAR